MGMMLRHHHKSPLTEAQAKKLTEIDKKLAGLKKGEKDYRNKRDELRSEKAKLINEGHVSAKKQLKQDRKDKLEAQKKAWDKKVKADKEKTEAAAKASEKKRKEQEAKEKPLKEAAAKAKKEAAEKEAKRLAEVHKADAEKDKKAKAAKSKEADKTEGK